jgi:hypothetical protein
MADLSTQKALGSLDVSRLPAPAAKAAAPFFERVAGAAGSSLLSIAVVGSAATPDYRPGVSDINSALVLDHVDVTFLDRLAAMGKRHGRKGLAAPLLFTPEYIERSLDVFPLEFLEFQSAHVTVYGRDFLDGLSFGREHVRLAAERELKGLLVNLRRGYLSSLGTARALEVLLVSSLNSVVPVLRGLLFIKGAPVPTTKREVVSLAANVLRLPKEPFENILAMRTGARRLPAALLRETFREFYDAIEAQSLEVDRL